MASKERIDFRFEFDGQINRINRAGYESVEHFKTVAVDLLQSGLYIAGLHKKHNLPPDMPQLISNSFREGPGQRYLIKLIVEDQIQPHPDFWRNEIGRKLEAELKNRQITPKAVR